MKIFSLIPPGRHMNSNSNTRDSLKIASHPARVPQHRQSNESFVLSRSRSHLVLIGFSFLARKKDVSHLVLVDGFFEYPSLLLTHFIFK